MFRHIGGVPGTIRIDNLSPAVEKMFTKGERELMDRATGLTGYNFRKTQVSHMHEKGADLSTIAKQTGHKSLQTLSKCFR